MKTCLLNVINDIATCYRKVVKRTQEITAIADIPLEFLGKTPDAVAANLQLLVLVHRAKSSLVLLAGVGGRRCVPGLPVSSNPLTPGRSQMSRVLYKVLQKAYVPSSTGPSY